MAKYYDYWTHGVAAEIEYPDRLTDHNGNAPAHPRRAGWGTQIFQKQGFNWFHFALPTPTRIRSTKRPSAPSDRPRRHAANQSGGQRICDEASSFHVTLLLPPLL